VHIRVCVGVGVGVCTCACVCGMAMGRGAEAAPFGFGEQDGGTGWGEAQKAGVKWGGGFSNPLSNSDDTFQTELVNGEGNPVIISFQKPKGWKVSTNTGISVQNYVTAESAYVLVAPASTESVSELNPKYVLDKVFDIRGRYGTFGKIDTIDVKKTASVTEGKYQYKYIDFTFSSFTPGGREVERNGCIKVGIVDGDCIMLIETHPVAHTATRFATLHNVDSLSNHGQVEVNKSGYCSCSHLLCRHSGAKDAAQSRGNRDRSGQQRGSRCGRLRSPPL